MITSEQVARLAGVSRTTVSRVLNGTGRISEEVRQRVLEAAATLGYEPNVVAQSMVRQRSRTIVLGMFHVEEGLSFSRLGETKHYFYLDVLKYIEAEAAEADYDLLQPSRPQDMTPEGYVRSLRTRNVAGAILLALSSADARIPALVQADLPTVFIDAVGQGRFATYIKSDNGNGARQVTEHLLSLGHRRIAFLTGSLSNMFGMERILGAQQAFTSAGYSLDPDLIRQSGWNTEQAYEAACQLLNERRDFTAIVAGSDLMAMGILRALREQGLCVPKDVSLTGFDDVGLARYTEPGLTTVRQDKEAMGRQAIQLLLRMIEGEEYIPPVTLPTRLVVRQSTGPAPIA
ncbi:LacI family DNA-binding transcriptional regulator [Ktedonospora formicarum]|uniref:LacI family transcriptional regulator n=1 Tax=Ktedonospora formicarum TaxID=2778364 RepID=A0A8J3HYQ7_9CHLR|nr:LacI family DNA-binding transcriptional regulator [Ktedonospora formicarum]GHO46667.1 LacI family transcriptional regulator [Ktedonospora formicarum]